MHVSQIRLMSTKLPPILAGPILRRAEPHRVCIWIATSESVRVKAYILATESLSNTLSDLLGIPPDSLGKGEAESVQLGKNLHITLVQALPSGSSESLKSGAPLFPTNKVLAYDLEIWTNSSSIPQPPVGATQSGKRLKDFGLIDGPNAINYPGVALPTFFLSGSGNPLNLLHGSCRKLHGPEEDSMAAADEVIGKNISNLTQRPSVLFLTGDQIYADDVPTPLINHITELGNQVLGWGFKERVPDIGETSELRVKNRETITQETVRFTSTHAQNHIFSFAEYAALYLISWNVENWPDSYPKPKRPPSVSETEPTRFQQAQKVEEEIQEYQKEIENVEKARKALPRVRRALANIPTYMMFDDHDVTDDWNLTEEWRENVEASPSGRRVVANALAAFWAFQAWGNDPEMFKADFISAITDYLKNEGTQGDKVFEKTLWEFPSWTFRVPTEPPSILLDTRTGRAYDTPKGASRLLNRKALENLKAHAHGTMGKPLLIVSPAPVYGFELIESLQNEVPKYVGPYKLDYEAWRSNLQGFLDFMKYLNQEIRPCYCIFLSGDVHYAFSISAAFTFMNNTLPMTQLTSSALKNSGIGKAGATIAGYNTPVTKLTDRRLAWERTTTSGKRQKLMDRIANEEVLEPDLDDVIREIGGIEAKLKVRPLILSPEEKEDLDILEKPDWEETRTYVFPSRFLKWPLIPDNNIGLVRLPQGGSQLEHQLHLRKKDERIEILTATLDVNPLIGINKP